MIAGCESEKLMCHTSCLETAVPLMTSGFWDVVSGTDLVNVAARDLIKK